VDLLFPLKAQANPCAMMAVPVISVPPEAI
jgi:hypothetical protein